MHSAFLKSNSSLRLSNKLSIRLSTVTQVDGEDVKSDEKREITNFEWANENHDFTKINENHLEEVFLKLRTRCPETWTTNLEILSRDFHNKFKILRLGGAKRLIARKSKTYDIITSESQVLTLMS